MAHTPEHKDIGDVELTSPKQALPITIEEARRRILAAGETPVEETAPTTTSTAGLVTDAKDVDMTKDEAARFDTEEELKAEIESRRAAAEPTGGAPAPLDRDVEFQKLREEQGVADLETQAVDLESQLEAELANLRAFRAEELSGAGTLGFARGRISAEERAVQEQVDFINRQLRTINARLKVKNQNIRDIMNLQEADFQDAKEQYERDFEINLGILNQITAEEDKQDLHDRTTYQTLTNFFKDVALDEIPETTMDRIEVLEARIGYPTGTFRAVKEALPDSKTVMHGTSFDADGNQFAWFVQQAPNEEPVVVRVDTGGVSTKKITEGQEEQEQKEDFAKARSIIEDSPDLTEAELRSKIQEDVPGLSESDINSLLKQRLNAGEIPDFSKELLFAVWNPRTFVSSAGELADAKEAAKAKLVEGEILLFDETREIRLTADLIEKIKQEIDSLTDHNALRTEFDKS